MSAVIELVMLGGPVVMALVALSVFALSVCIIKWLQLRGFRDKSAAAPEAFINALETGIKNVEVLPSSAPTLSRADLCRYTLELIQTSSLSLEQIKLESLRRARLAIAARQQYLRILDVIAAIAPLLGLFGTVLGMIAAFKAMEAAGAQVDPAVLSGGIWLALLTTAVGVAVAIPVSVAHSWFERQVELAGVAIQDDLEHMFTLAAVRGFGKSRVSRLASAS